MGPRAGPAHPRHTHHSACTFLGATLRVGDCAQSLAEWSPRPAPPRVQGHLGNERCPRSPWASLYKTQRCCLGHVLHGEKTSPRQPGKLEQGYLRFSLSLFFLVTQPCLTLCDPMDCSSQTSLSFTISWSLLRLMSINAILPSHPLLPPSPPALYHPQHQDLSQ